MNLKIIFAKQYGFCYGVKRAVEMADRAATLPGKTYTYGNLIHNPQVVADLLAKGVANVDAIQDAPDGANIIIRSHGVLPEAYELAATKHCHVVDATCPNVQKAQKTAADFQSVGKKVLIVGDPNHPEVKSIAGWATEPIIIRDAGEVEKLAAELEYGVLCQTTLEQEKFAQVVAALQSRGIEFEVKPTICLATKQRQDAAVELAHQVQAMLIVGGYKSANTTHLYELVQAICPSWHIEGPDDLKPGMFEGIETLGITAGASTPDWLLAEIVKKLENF